MELKESVTGFFLWISLQCQIADSLNHLLNIL